MLVNHTSSSRSFTHQFDPAHSTTKWPLDLLLNIIFIVVSPQLPVHTRPTKQRISYPWTSLLAPSPHFELRLQYAISIPSLIRILRWRLSNHDGGLLWQLSLSTSTRSQYSAIAYLQPIRFQKHSTNASIDITLGTSGYPFLAVLKLARSLCLA